MTGQTYRDAGMDAPWQAGPRVWVDGYEALVQPWRLGLELTTAVARFWGDAGADWLTHYFPAGDDLVDEGRALLAELLASSGRVAEAGLRLPVTFFGGAPVPTFAEATAGLMEALGRAIQLWLAWLNRTGAFWTAGRDMAVQR